MARLQLIFPLLFWELWRATRDDADAPLFGPAAGTAVYVFGLLAVLAAIAWLAARAMRRSTPERAAPVPRFNQTVRAARWFVLGWHATALWSLGFGEAVEQFVPNFGGRFETLPLFASALPVIVAWAGLIFAQYPLERAVKEQNAWYALQFGEPVRAVPNRWAYTAYAMRTQVLFTLSPLLSVGLLRDGLHTAAETVGLRSGVADVLPDLVAGVAVFALAPELLRRVLPTRPLPASPLRERLVAFAKNLRLGVRDVLLWNTHHSVGNAAVMGVVPGVRYVMITDLLLETLSPEQIEAVFAHEAGHVKHRHIAWYAVYFLAIVCLLQAAQTPAVRWLLGRGVSATTAEIVTTVSGLAVVVTLFGVLSRAFERQADAFAARRVCGVAGPREGAAVFGSALRAVARVNNMPMDASGFMAGRPMVGRWLGRLSHHAATWLHGSIRGRIEHVAELADDPAAAERFDRAMLGVRCGLAAALIGGVAAALWWG